MHQYLLNDHWVFNAGNDPGCTSADSAHLNVDIENQLQALRPPGKSSEEILSLSETLNRLAQYRGTSREQKFRNPNGVYMKLMNFRRFDPEYTSQDKVGLTRGNKLEKVLWDRYVSDTALCHQVADAIRQGINDNEFQPMDEDMEDVVEAEEGRLLTVLHRRRERNRKIVDKKKAKVLREQGNLACEICGFDFEQTYGQRGKGFIECHHTQPVSEYTGQKTSLKDLALVCANCHRMIHAHRPWLSIKKVKELLQQ